MPLVALVAFGLSVIDSGRSWSATLAPIAAVTSGSAATTVALSSDDAVKNGQPSQSLVALTVAKGDTISSLLIGAGIDWRDVDAAIAKLRRHFNPRKLRVGQTMTVVLEHTAGKAPRLAALSLELGRSSYVVVERRGGRRYVANVMNAPVGLEAETTADSESGRTLRLNKGDTLVTLLVRAGAGRNDADNAARAIGRHVNMRKLQVGQAVTVAFDDDDASSALTAVSLRVGPGVYVVAARDSKGDYWANRATAPYIPAATDVAAPVPEATQAPQTDVVEQADAVAEPKPEADDGRMVYLIERGDTLTDVLVSAGAERKAAYAAAAAIGRHFNMRKLRVGQELVMVFDPASLALAAVSLKLKKGKYVTAGRRDGVNFESNVDKTPLVPFFAETVGETTPEFSGAAPALLLTGKAEYKSLQVRKGDTLTTALLRLGVVWRDAGPAIVALSRHFDPRRLQVGHEISAVFDRTVSGQQARLSAISLALGEKSHVIARREESGGFIAWPAAEALGVVYDEALAVAALLPLPPEVELAALPADTVHKTFDVRSGDTLMKALLRAGSKPRDADAAIRALQNLFDPRKLRAGQTLTVSLAPSDGVDVLQRLSIDIEPGRKIESGRVEDGGFAARAVEIPLERMLVHTGGRIESSLYVSAVEAGVPNPILLELIRAFSFDIDFQREIQRGDTFEVMFERYLDDSGKPVREGNVLYAAMSLSGSPLVIYRYTARDGFTDYYNEDGHSIRKALLRTPIDGARLTSGYGTRKHPTLGYTKMHRGVDFGAKRGTPIMVAGDGVIEFAAWNGSYGKYVRIRHRGSYSTAYAHLDRIASGIQRTRRVKQRQIIGYVGSTGRSTGTHLHYEVLQGGKQINPLKVKLPTGAKLKGVALAAFQQSRQKIERQLAALPLVRQVSEAMAQAAVQAEACGEEAAAVDPAC
ncbi:MAG: peptidoglycan DD-metalloendopeptidase family protein [Alphaproteobacteria bacterium]